jgi:hypothetical protein
MVVFAAVLNWGLEKSQLGSGPKPACEEITNSEVALRSSSRPPRREMH